MKTAESSEARPAKRQPWDRSNNLQEQGLLTVVCLLPLIPMSSYCSAGLRALQSPATALATNGHKMANLLSPTLLVSGDMVFLWG